MSVALVGAGPGDPDLITRRGLRLIRQCQVLVYDRLVGPELVAEAPLDAILVDRDGIELSMRVDRQGARLNTVAI